MKSFPLQLVIVLTILITFLLTNIILYSRNTLLVHPEWISGKRLLAAPIMGSSEGFTTRNILNQNRLNLQEWHGYNEILFNRILHLGSMRFSFLLEKDSYLNILFNKNKSSFSGVRMSRNPKFPSMFFHATSDGRFLLKEPITGLSLANSWHTAELIFQSNTLSFLIDGQEIQRFQETSLDQQIIGFRSSKNAVIVDDVKVNDIHENLIIWERFRNNKGYWRLLFLNFSLIVGIIGIVLAASNVMKKDRTKTFFGILLFQLCAIIILISCYTFDYYYWSGKYHHRAAPTWGRVQAGKQLNHIEALKVILFTRFPFPDSYYTRNFSKNPQSLIRFLEINPRTEYKRIDLKIIRNDRGNERIEVIDSNRDTIQTYLKHKPFSPGVKILFLGTSQMWGAGATFSSARIAVQVHECLSNHFARKDNLYIINASQRGSRSKSLLQRYKNHLFLFEPDLIVVNLSNNDSQIDEFHKNLDSLIKFNKNNTGKSFFILEANTIEKNNLRLKKMHDTMISVAKENNIPWIDLHSYLSNPAVYDTGFLWWDIVHMTSYGQKLAAEFISQGIIDNFEFLDKK